MPLPIALPNKTNNKLNIGKIGLAVSCIKLHKTNQRPRELMVNLTNVIPIYRYLHRGQDY